MNRLHIAPNRLPIRRAVDKAIDLVREDRALRRAARQMPKPVPWDWAAPRLVPLLSRPAFDPPGEGLVRVTTELGFAVEFGIDLGTAITEVDEPVAQRWECSPGQLMETAMTNLTKRAATLPATVVASGVLSGRQIRIIQRRPIWASSLILVPDSLMRLLGDHDQMIATAGRATLISLPIETPAEVAANIVVDFEMSDVRPLFFSPFMLVDRKLVWESAGDDEW